MFNKADGKRAHRAAEKLTLIGIYWDSTHRGVFLAFKHALEQQVRLTNLDINKCLYVATDESDFLWPRVLTQTPVSNQVLPFANQNHEPLPSLSGRFRESEMRQSTLERKPYAIMATVEHMHWLLITNQ